MSQPSPRLPRVVVVGCGYWGRNLIRCFDQLGVLAGLCDASVEALREQHELFPKALLFGDLNEVLADASINAVVLATPAPRHFAQAQQILDSGRDVYVEKPVTLAAHEAEALVQLAKQGANILMAGHLLEYHPAFVALKHHCDEGRLGDINYLSSTRASLGKIRAEENVWWSFAPHDVAMLCSLAGGPPESIAVTGSSWIQPGIADAAAANLMWSNGIRGKIFVTWSWPFKEHKLVVVGDRDMAVFDDTLQANKLSLAAARVDAHEPVPQVSRGSATYPSYEAGEPLLLECAHFVDCCQTRRAPRTGGPSLVAVVATLEAGQRSLENGGAPVPVRMSL